VTRILRTDVAQERAQANACDDFIRTSSHTADAIYPKVESAFDRRRSVPTESRPKFDERVQGVSPGRRRRLVLRHEDRGDYVELSE